jgi:hypothetical protein
VQTTPRLMRSRWFMPGFALGLATLVLVAFWLGGNPRDGWISFAVIAGVGLVFLLGRRSDTLAGLGGPGRDERWAQIDVYATAVAGVALILALIAFWLWELSHGRSGEEYGRIMAIGGFSYVVAVLYLRFRT